MSRQHRRQLRFAAMGTIVVALGASGCGSSATAPTAATATPAATAASPSATTSGNSGSSGAASSAPVGASSSMTVWALPKSASEYGQILIDAWTRNDKATAAKVASPAAVTAIFAHPPIKDLVNYSCEDENPKTCGWIGEKDLRVELTIDAAKVGKATGQAITQVRVGIP